MNVITIITGAVVVTFCNIPSVANNMKRSADRQLGEGLHRSIAKGIAATVKNSAAVSIKKVLPQNR